MSISKKAKRSPMGDLFILIYYTFYKDKKGDADGKDMEDGGIFEIIEGRWR